MWTVQTQRQILNVMTSLCLIMMLAWLGALQSYSDHFDDSRADAIIERERKHIEEEFAGLETGDFLANNIIDQGGEPVRAMLVTSWRSGSTFLGDILYSHPGTFYHYEPLGYNDIVQVRSGTRAKYATHTLENLMHCNYKSLDLYMKAAKIQHWMHSHNTRLYGHCNLKEGDQSVCEDPEFLSRFCSLYPYQLTKTVRLRLNLTQYLVSDPSLNVKVLYLVRDPRGTLESRKHRAWCHGAPDCEDPSHLCQDLVSDYHAYKRLSRMHPGRFKLFRYEDFSMNPVENSKDMLNFFGLTFHEKVQHFLKSHTKKRGNNPYSTFRDTKAAAFAWKGKQSMEEVLKIQSKCKLAMKLWGYNMIKSDDDLEVFDPILDDVIA